MRVVAWLVIDLAGHVGMHRHRYGLGNRPSRCQRFRSLTSAFLRWYWYASLLEDPRLNSFVVHTKQI